VSRWLRWNEAVLDRAHPKPTGLLDPRSEAWTVGLLAEWEVIRRELDALVADRIQFPGVSTLIGADQGNEGRWTTFMLCANGKVIPSNAERAPATVALLDRVPGLSIAAFSVLGPHCHLPRHRGPNRGALRYQLGMIVPGEPGAARLVVGETEHVWTEGAELLFDDSVEHEAWNESDGDRYIFFVEFIWPRSGPAGLVNRATQQVYRLAGRRLGARAAELDAMLNR